MRKRIWTLVILGLALCWGGVQAADTKISALSAGNPAQSGDEIPINRGGANFKVTAASIAALVNPSFIDSTFTICDDGTPTKCMKFQASGIAGATTRTYTVPNADGSLPLIGIQNAWSVTQAFQGGFTVTSDAQTQWGGSFVIAKAANQTPDALAILPDANSNTILISEIADNNFDFNNGACGTSACVDPGLVLHSHNQSISEYGHRMSAGQVFRQIKALTKSSATTFVQLPVPNLQAGATGATIDYTISGSDGTDTQVRHGTTRVQAVAKAGTVTCGISPTTETTDGSTYASTSGAGTLTYTLTCSTGSNLINVQANAVNSLGSTPTIDYAVTVTGPSEIKPQ
jgi:hypothetical protein